MKRNIRRFTLVEMLTVVAIIGLLAGIVIPTVVIAQNRGRVTQAKSDIAALMLAMKQAQNDYGKLAVPAAGSSYTFGGVSVGKKTASVNSENYEYIPVSGDIYKAFVAELSAPKNGKLSGKVKLNKRRRIYLEPRNSFDPTKDYDHADNASAMWLDPWGNPYVIYIGIGQKDEMGIDGTTKVISTPYAVYSIGPNGTDDKGCNVELDTCITSSDSGNHKLHDDIASWNL